MFFTYYKFLFLSLIKRYTLIIVGVFFWLVYAVFLLIVPASINENPWYLWSNVAMSPLTFNMYIGAIFAAIISIAVFKEYRDDGTELIIVSKPLHRTKMILVKTAVFVSFIFGYAITLILLSLFTLCFRDVTAAQVGSLLLSIFIANFIFITLFGAIAIFISIFLNKIWTIVLNVILIVLMVIYTNVAVLTVKTPAQKLTENGHSIQTIQYLNRNNNFATAAAIAPVTNDLGEIDLKSVNDEQQLWEDTNKKDKDWLNIFKFNAQFSLINNMFGMQDIVQTNASHDFGSNTWFKYHFNEAIIDNDPIDRPLFYVNLYDASFHQYVPSPSDGNTYLAALLWFVSREQINYLGGTHISSTSALSNISNNLEPKLDESVGVAINGRKGSLNTALYLTQHDLLPNQEEKEVFDNAINNLIYESGTSTPNQGLLSWNTSNYAYTLNPVYNSQTNWNNCGDNKVTNIYEWLNWYFTQNGDNAKKLNIDNKRDDPYHLMIELLKFKLYVFANVTKRINSSSAWSDLFPNYDNCANTSPPLPLGTTSTLLLPRSGINNENWYTRDNWDSPYFYVNGHENTYILSCCRALLEWAIIKDDYGFIHTTGDYSRNDSYVEYLNVNTENFLYGYETLAASFSTEPITDFINIAVYWLLATIIVAAIVIVIYQRIDFK